MRLLLGIVAGIIVAGACVGGIEVLGHVLYSMPPGYDLENPRDVARLMELLPAGAFAFVLAAWFVGALAGAATANWIARRAVAGWIVAALVICAGVATMVIIPHPLWMWAAGMALPLLAGLIAQRFVRPAG